MAGQEVHGIVLLSCRDLLKFDAYGETIDQLKAMMGDARRFLYINYSTNTCHSRLLTASGDDKRRFY